MNIVSLTVVFILVAMSASQTAFGDDFGVNITKLSDDIIRALRNDLHNLKYPSACEFLRDDIRTRDCKLDKSIAALHKHNQILQRETRELHHTLDTLLSSVMEMQMMLPNLSDTENLPPILRIGNTSYTYTFAGPEGTLASFLAARHLMSMNHSSQSPIRILDDPDTTSDNSAPIAAAAGDRDRDRDRARLKTSPEDDWREPVLFITMLTMVILYIVFLLCIFIKKTVDAQLRQQPPKANTNASIEFWKSHREEEREKKAREELREARERMTGSEQRRTGVDGIRGFMSS